MIHCDEVFDILTRGPFPTGAPSDGIVEAHLNHCEDCRQLAEALRPAIELLQEAISPEESDGLPRYGGAAQPRAAWSEQTRSPLKTEPKIARPLTRAATGRRFAADAWPWRSIAKFATAACVGLMVAGMLRQLALSDGAQRRALTPVACAASWRPALSGNEWASGQRLRPDCRKMIEGYSLSVPGGGAQAGEVTHLTCCLGCHAARGGHAMATDRIAGFVLACQACH